MKRQDQTHALLYVCLNMRLLATGVAIHLLTIEFTDRVVAVVRYRDGSVIDVVHQVVSVDTASRKGSLQTMVPILITR